MVTPEQYSCDLCATPVTLLRLVGEQYFLCRACFVTYIRSEVSGAIREQGWRDPLHELLRDLLYQT